MMVDLKQLRESYRLCDPENTATLEVSELRELLDIIEQQRAAFQRIVSLQFRSDNPQRILDSAFKIACEALEQA